MLFVIFSIEEDSFFDRDVDAVECAQVAASVGLKVKPKKLQQEFQALDEAQEEGACGTIMFEDFAMMLMDFLVDQHLKKPNDSFLENA